jgi:hypothetical protein
MRKIDEDAIILDDNSIRTQWRCCRQGHRRAVIEREAGTVTTAFDLPRLGIDPTFLCQGGIFMSAGVVESEDFSIKFDDEDGMPVNFVTVQDVFDNGLSPADKGQ